MGRHYFLAHIALRAFKNLPAFHYCQINPPAADLSI